MKRCTKCNEQKPVTEFGTHHHGRDGLRAMCKACCADRRREREAKQPRQDNYYFRRKARDPQFVERIRERNRTRSTPEWRAKQMEYYRARMQDPEYRQQRSEQNSLRRLGITKEQREALFASQGHACAVCKTTQPAHRGKANGWHIDHDHDTGRVRGILCGNCNNALGFIRENADTARSLAVYITSWPRPTS